MEGEEEVIVVTCTSAVNIAVIKYWGKRQESLILPLNSSLSACLNQEDLKTTTTVVASKRFESDELWLNGKKENIANERVQKCLKEIRARASGKVVDPKTGRVIIAKPEDWNNYKVHIVSVNNFPTAAGLASSASGYCCLVYTLAQVFGVQGEISTIARMGSGSACRSMYGGWVKWEMGQLEDGSDSKAIQVAPETHWPEMQILVLVVISTDRTSLTHQVNDQKKDTSSTDGMQQSAKTSKMLQTRIKSVVPERMIQMENAILQKDYQTFGDLTMKDSDDFHAVCADTDPPIYYLKPISHQIIHIINSFNKYYGKIRAAYTFDAGPNAVIYLLKENVVALMSLVLHFFPPQQTPMSSFFKNQALLKEIQQQKIPDDLLQQISRDITPDALKYVLHTSVGQGPQVVSTDETGSLVDLRTGLPKLLIA